jgi:hypothetical protein
MKKKSSKKPTRPKAGRRAALAGATGSDLHDKLYSAVQEYVEGHGGKLIVIGGVQIQEWPEDNPLCFRLAIKCTGRKPVFAKSPNDQAQ